MAITAGGPCSASSQGLGLRRAERRLAVGRRTAPRSTGRGVRSIDPVQIDRGVRPPIREANSGANVDFPVPDRPTSARWRSAPASHHYDGELGEQL